MNPPALSVAHFGYRYADGTEALEDLNLEVAQGESLCIIGPNGAGKSTLLLCLAGLLRGKGDITILGAPLTTANVRRVRQRLALVFQDPDDQLFMPAVEEDVAFGPLNLGLSAEEVNQRVEEALKLVQLTDKRKRPPHHLSYGEKRRAALATALAMKPEILLLDEPTSNLDPATRRQLMEHLKSLNITKIVATHDLDLAATLCQRCALLADGRIRAMGTTKDILSDDGLLRSYRLL